MDTGEDLTPSMNWDIPRISDEPLHISLQSNDRLFIVGPNGSGKSALIQHLVSGHQGRNIRRISAHRQTWLDSGSLNITPLGRRQFEEQSTSTTTTGLRWRLHPAFAAGGAASLVGTASPFVA